MSSSKYMNNFDLDEYRAKLVKDKKIEELIKTYNYAYELENPNTKKFWNKKIERITTFEELDPMSKDRIIHAVKMINGEKGEILDLGFGNGYFEQKLTDKNKNFKLYGIDVSSVAVARAKKRYGNNFLLGSISKLNFHDNVFDFVVSLECLEHVPSNKIFETLREVRRVLKKDGKIIFSIPINEKYSQKFNPNNHLRRYTKELFIQELILAGFKVEKTMQFYAFSSLYHLKKLLQLFFPNKWRPNILLVKGSTVTL